MSTRCTENLNNSRQPKPIFENQFPLPFLAEKPGSGKTKNVTQLCRLIKFMWRMHIPKYGDCIKSLIVSGKQRN